ncbi:hypothetical protein [Corynebacterium sp. p3-SID1194]|uniref:hypothetical protein n=1 Tax=Corynebacterium sp. p3-SID1194 TaxID=2916105 RepID=UPI0021A26FDF|nr:hypothetical protein [Corynebacterium sp. p3-SID1194]MCT1451029.1 hypothetical protein [Corynebacterium sp. p3-SID1194]
MNRRTMSWITTNTDRRASSRTSRFKTVLVAAALVAPLSLAGCGGIFGEKDTNESESGSSSSESGETMEISSGPLTIDVPKDWEKLDKDDDVIRDRWVVGAMSEDPAVQIRMTRDTGEAPEADATNQIALYGNLFAQDNEIQPRGVEDVEVEGADDAQIAYFEFIDDDGDPWDGLFLSAANRETGNVSTLEMMSLRDSGLSQDEALEIVDTARYDKSKE